MIQSVHITVHQAGKKLLSTRQSRKSVCYPPVGDREILSVCSARHSFLFRCLLETRHPSVRSLQEKKIFASTYYLTSCRYKAILDQREFPKCSKIGYKPVTGITLNRKETRSTQPQSQRGSKPLEENGRGESSQARPLYWLRHTW